MSPAHGKLSAPRTSTPDSARKSFSKAGVPLTLDQSATRRGTPLRLLARQPSRLRVHRTQAANFATAGRLRKGPAPLFRRQYRGAECHGYGAPTRLLEPEAPMTPTKNQAGEVTSACARTMPMELDRNAVPRALRGLALQALCDRERALHGYGSGNGPRIACPHNESISRQRRDRVHHRDRDQ